MRNIKLRMTILENGLKHFEVAEEMGVCISTFSRWMQSELPPKRKEEILKAVERLVAKRK